MKLKNLGDGTSVINFEEALKRGIAPDGSLYYPVKIPTFSHRELRQLETADEQQIAYMVLKKWLGDEIDSEDLRKIVNGASSFPIPIVKVGEKYILEMFHGPTMAFKDVAARYLSRFMSHFNKNGDPLTVLVATSGDTGGAIAHGFGGLKNIQTVVLFPKGRVSELQYEQLTRAAENIIPLEIDGSFDDCQSLVKQAFVDSELSKKLQLTSANSISIGRLLPQVTYYAQLYAKLARDDLRVVVPTGNLGNLTAALFAWKMGIPFASFLCANNTNDSVLHYLETGTYEPRNSIQTLSNAMDVGAPNNLPRFIELFDNDVHKARNMVSAARISDKDTIKTIKKVYGKHDYLLDPHTAVGWTASEKLPSSRTDVIVSTASPIKFSREIFETTRIKVSNEDQLEELRTKTKRVRRATSDYAYFKKELENLL